MAHRLSRRELYDLVWSEPMKKLAPRFGLSDVAVAKICRKADVPVPERGYWAQLQAGKTVFKRPLPPRGPGMSDMVSIGATSYETHEQIVSRLLNEPLPPVPTFSEELGHVSERVRKMVGKVSVPPLSARLHPLIARLFDEDEKRRQARQSGAHSFFTDGPFFETPIQQRRLRLLNAIFLAAQRCGARPLIRDRQACDTAVQVGQQNVAFFIDGLAERRPPARPGLAAEQKPKREKLRLWIGSKESPSSGKAWADSHDGKLERHVMEIVVELLVTGEANYRANAVQSHTWWLQRRAELEAEARRRKEEEERRERERLAKLEKERVQHLLDEADNWRRAADLRALVETVRATRSPGNAEDTEKLARWSASVLALADRIDPIRSGRLPDDMAPLASPSVT
jgi:hypothetical protein